MKLLKVISTPLILKPLRDRWYKVAVDAKCTLVTDCGCLTFTIKEGFEYDSRSGGWFVDLIADHIGTQEIAWSYVVHDCFYFDFGICFETANDLLRQQLRLAGMGRIRAGLVHSGVSTSIARNKYGNNTPEELENKTYINFAWTSQ